MYKLKEIISHKFSEKTIAILFFAAFVLLIIPIVLVGKYDCPQLDDYGYSAYTYHAWRDTHNLIEVLKWAAYRVKVSWYAWQGTFSSIFMMSLCPSIFNYRLYKLVPAFITGSMSLSCFALSNLLVREILKKKGYFWITVGAAMSILTVEKVYNIASGIFWYNAAVHYMFMHSMMILMVVNVVRMVRAKKAVPKILFLLLSMILAVAAGGSNYATSLMGLLLLVGVCLLLTVVYKVRAWICIFPLLVNSYSFYKNVTAPGNFVRGDYFTGMGFSPVKSIFKSFLAAFEYMDEWMNHIFVWLFLILLVPVFWQGLKECEFSFGFPGGVSILSICFLATGFTSSFYTLGDAGLDRLKNVICMTFFILLVINEAYWIGWIQRKRQIQMGTINVGAFLLLLLLMTLNVMNTSAYRFTTHAAVYFNSYESAMYYQEFLIRMRLLEDGAGEDVVLKPHDFRPGLFLIEDFTDDPDYWSNQQLAEYYGNRSVVVEDNPE